MGLGRNDSGAQGDSYNFKIRVLKLLSAIGGAGAGGATEATLLQVLSELQNIDISVDNIEIDADQINLNTDTLEALIAASNALLTTIDTSLNAIEADTSSIDSKIPALGQALMAGSLPVVIASDQSAIPISAASLPLPTGAATEATLSSINAKTPMLGQTLMTLSSPVVIASDQSAIPISAASLPLPSGAATSALQTSGNASLTSIDAKTPSFGQTLMTLSSPVVIASDQSAIPVTVSSLPLPTGAATSANQTGLGAQTTKINDGVDTVLVTALGEMNVLESNSAAIAASLSIIDDWDESDRAKVNLIVGSVGVQGASGVVTASTQRVVLATDVALPAGTNAIGKLSANSGVDIGDVDVTSIIPGTGATNLGKAEDAAHTTGDTGVMLLAVRNDANASLSGTDLDYTPISVDANGAVHSSGDIAHDGVDAGNPQKIGYKAIAHGANPTAVAANDRTHGYANRHGIPWVIGGHPNIVNIRANYTTAQTDTAIITVGGGSKIVVTSIFATLDNATTVDVAVRIGFGAATTPTTTGVIMAHPGIPAGSGLIEGTGAGIIGVGADGEDLRITSEVPTTGSLDITVSYYTIES